jgi:hypothetical protein
MPKALLLAVLIVIVVCKPSHAELYQYTDEKGNIHVTDNAGAVPGAQPQRGSAAGEQEDQGLNSKAAMSLKGIAGPEPAASSKAGKEPDPAAQRRSSEALPAQNETSLNTNIQSSNPPANVAGPSKLPPEFQEQFKDVMAASSIPPEGASASCPDFKKGLNSDMDNIMQAIRELAEAKKKGDLGVLATLKGMRVLKSVGWVAYRHVTGPEQCVKEFDKENEKRLEAMTKEINAMTEEIKDK